MSLSDKFYEGLSAPLPVVGAQMPVDLVPYGREPLDALDAHEQKYKQLDYMNQLSEQASIRLLKQLADAESDYGYDNMDKVSFVGSNPISRRAYFMRKLADSPAPVVVPTPAAPTTSESVQQAAQAPAPVAPGSDAPPLPSASADSGGTAAPAPVAPPPVGAATTGAPYNLGQLGRAPKAPPRPKPPTAPPRPSYAAKYQGGQTRFVGQGAQELGDSGDVANRLRELGLATGIYRKSMAGQPDTAAPQEQERSFFDNLMHNVEHYGTRAARGLSTAAQMGASKLYDAANQGGYLGDDSFIGRNFSRDTRESLNREMADINASLYHAYGGAGNAANSDVYAHRFKNMDMDLSTAGIQGPQNDLLDANKFRSEQIRRQLANRWDANTMTAEQRANLETGIADRINNYYGFDAGGQANRLGTGRIIDDLDGTAFTRALRETGNEAVTNPSSVVTRAAALEDMLKENPQLLASLTQRFGEAADKAGVPLATYVAGQISSGLDPRSALVDAGGAGIEDDIYETDQQRAERYENTRRITKDILDVMPTDHQAQFIKSMNPMVIQKAEEINQLMDTNPQEALKQINAMDPEEAKYLLDQVSMFSKYISPETAEQVMDYDKYRISEDAESPFGGLLNFGGSDVVNRAKQKVGRGGNISDLKGIHAEDLTAQARNRSYGWNSMRDTPRGRFFLAEVSPLGNTYFNPETGEVNYEVGTDIMNYVPGLGYDTSERLPPQYHQQYRDAVGAENSGLRDDYFLVDDGIFGNYYWNPYSGDRNYEWLYGNTNKFQDKPLPPQFHKQYQKQFNRAPSYRGN